MTRSYDVEHATGLTIRNGLDTWAHLYSANLPKTTQYRLVERLERCVTKLEILYHQRHPEAPWEECWAEAEGGRELLQMVYAEKPEVAAYMGRESGDSSES